MINLAIFYLEGILNLFTDDFLILRFLRVCKFNLERTKTRIRNYYKLQSDLLEWLKNKDLFRKNYSNCLI